MAYVPDSNALGNPGILGFIGTAVKTVAKVVTGVVKGVAGGGTVQVAPPQVIVQTPAPTVSLASSVPSWVLPVAVGGGALVLVMMLRRR